jgi:V/A-type H+/Na+-transporting ATPase subunit I
MPWGERLRPVRMERVAVVAPVETLHELLVRVADAGAVELDAAATPTAAIDTVQDAAVVRDSVAALAGWAPADAVPASRTGSARPAARW